MTWLMNPYRFVAGGGGGGGGGVPPFTVAQLDIGAGEVGATLTDFPVRVRLEDMPTGFWDVVASDGSDIRVTNSDGVQLPIDLIAINAVAKTGTLFFKATLTTTGQIFYLQAGSGVAAPAATDPLGRNAVWSAYHRAYVFAGNSGVDRTGSGTTFDMFNGALITNGFFENRANTRYATFAADHFDNWTISTVSFNGSSNFQVMVRYGNAIPGQTVDLHARGAFDGDRWRVFNWDNPGLTDGPVFPWGVIDSIAPARPHYQAFGRSGLLETLWVDGEAAVPVTQSVQRPSAGTIVMIGDPSSGDSFRGSWKFFLMRGVAPEEHWIRAEFRNWSEDVWLESFGGVGAYSVLYTAAPL